MREHGRDIRLFLCTSRAPCLLESVGGRSGVLRLCFVMIAVDISCDTWICKQLLRVDSGHTQKIPGVAQSFEL